MVDNKGLFGLLQMPNLSKEKYSPDFKRENLGWWEIERREKHDLWGK